MIMSLAPGWRKHFAGLLLVSRQIENEEHHSAPRLTSHGGAGEIYFSRLVSGHLDKLTYDGD